MEEGEYAAQGDLPGVFLCYGGKMNAPVVIGNAKLDAMDIIALQEGTIVALRQRCEIAEQQRDAAIRALNYNLAIANKAGRHAMKERDGVIKNLKELNYSVIEIASMSGLTRQRVYQILNEQGGNGQ